MPRADAFAGRPQVLAHRMLREGYPENTILSLEAALALRVDWVEFDVHVLRDGTLVSMHGTDVANTTDGEGELTEMTYDEVRKLDAGAGHRFGFVPVPRVEDILRVISEAPYLVRAEMHIHDLEEPEVLLAMVHEHGVVDRSYFNTDLVGLAQYIREDLHDDEARLSFNVATSKVEPYFAPAREFDVSYFCASLKVLDDTLVEKIHGIRGPTDPGGQVFVHSYPVQTPEDWDRMIAHGVDVVQTDRPAALIDHLRGRGFRFDDKHEN
ncbi:MAG: glycerophosphodiester phosphodiesterase [Promethearchaeota archaeon]